MDTFISGIASAIAVALIEKRLREGGTVEIPSLGIVLTADDLREPALRCCHCARPVGEPFVMKRWPTIDETQVWCTRCFVQHHAY